MEVVHIYLQNIANVEAQFHPVYLCIYICANTFTKKPNAFDGICDFNPSAATFDWTVIMASIYWTKVKENKMKVTIFT